MSLRAIVFLLLILSLNICCSHKTQTIQQNISYSVKEISSPCGNDSGEPRLSLTKNGQLLLSWLEKTGDKKHALRFAIRDKENWTDVGTVIEAENLLVNWADFPSIFQNQDGTFVASWLVKNAKNAHAYNIFISLSNDDGKNWSKPFTPHNDKTETEHGFVSMFQGSDLMTGFVWLDGRKYETEKHAQVNKESETDSQHGGHDKAKSNEMALRFASVNKDGILINEVELDGRVCDCCPTSAVVTNNIPLIAYRDRSDEEIRDISIIRFVGGQWTKPQTVSADNWKINGCPVNGPVVSAKDKTVAVAWYSEADSSPVVKIAFSNNTGESFNPPIKVNESKTVGRVDLLVLDDGSAVVSWIEGNAQKAELKARQIKADGTLSESFIVAQTSIERKSGFPKMIKVGNEIIFVWTDIATNKVRIAISKL